VRIGDDCPLVSGRGEQAPGPGVYAERLRAAKFDAATGRLGGGELGHRRGDLVRGDRLHQPEAESRGFLISREA
jgi:hypothetical protein